MSNPTRKKGRKGDRKFHRNEVKCAAYRRSKYGRNKERKLIRHLAVHVSDSCGRVALERLRTVI